MRVILTVASVGIIVGVVTSSGMMEVARSGMFNPGLFTFHEVMMLYLGVMFANIILLDLYNSWGLPTSTTVSLIFCLLGSAIAVSIYKISNDPALGVGSLGHFINTSRAMGIVSAILLSVVIAFTCGTIVMYISRTIFSFRYTVIFRRFGSLWCGASLTAIIYFAVFKGLKSLLADNAFVGMVDRHLLLSLFICWVACSVLLFFIQRFKINILRITILSGTFALALAFAGNDLVNFIGVPVAGFDAFSIAKHSGDPQMMMGALSENVPANFLILLAAGAMMILTLWTSKKAMHVSETELSLSAAQEDEGPEQYGSSVMSRTIVRAALNINAGIERIIPARVRAAVSHRFEYEDIEHSGAPLRHDTRYGQPHDLGHADRHSHLAQTPPFDHLCLLHGSHGFVARRPRMGPRKRRVPHLWRHDRHRRVVHHGAGRIPDRLRRRTYPDLWRHDGLRYRHGTLRLHAHPQQFPQERQDIRRPSRSRGEIPEHGRHHHQPARRSMPYDGVGDKDL